MLEGTFDVKRKFAEKKLDFVLARFFVGSHLSLKEVSRHSEPLDLVQLNIFDSRFSNLLISGVSILLESNEYVQQQMARDDGTTISRQCIVDWRQFCRDVAVDYFEQNPKVLGGPGKTVEIDENVVTKRKYQRGRLVGADYWFFGMVERESGDVVLVHVERRDAATLIPLIQKYILPGSTIISDLWKAYGVLFSFLPQKSVKTGGGG